mgnify:CR=1 FL=1
MLNISDKKIHDLTTRAKKTKTSDCSTYLSHTDRYNRDSAYRVQMQENNVPKWLVWQSTGHTARPDGQLGDQWPVE